MKYNRGTGTLKSLLLHWARFFERWTSWNLWLDYWMDIVIFLGGESWSIFIFFIAVIRFCCTLFPCLGPRPGTIAVEMPRIGEVGFLSVCCYFLDSWGLRCLGH